LHINRKSSTRAFDQYTVVNMTHRVIFVHQMDNRQIVVAPFVFSCHR
jgi:Na+-transporting NADH:ubiquinone oxidoreductase subunit NqrA